MLLTVLTSFKLRDGFELIVNYIKEGFKFGISVFAPVLFIGGFFFLGNQNGATAVLGEGAPGILNDISLFLSENIQMTKLSTILTQTAVALITGLDGSGFSGLHRNGTVKIRPHCPIKPFSSIALYKSSLLQPLPQEYLVLRLFLRRHRLRDLNL